jgi:hypothetical protein
MECAQRKGVCMVLGIIIIGLQSFDSFGKKGEKLNAAAGAGTSEATAKKDQFQWQEHSRLSWDDFRGSAYIANAAAAVTNCGIGIKTNVSTPGTRPEIIVYNTFYTGKSWVRTDAKIQSILDHEQGHFDLCEIYTRKLRERVSKFDITIAHEKQALINTYTTLNKEYESRQQAYEQETIHGTNIKEQKRWLDMISRELGM